MKRTPDELAFMAGHRQGRWGYSASVSPYAAGDRDPRAVAWRKGWTAGNVLHRQAIEAEDDHEPHAWTVFVPGIERCANCRQTPAEAGPSCPGRTVER